MADLEGRLSPSHEDEALDPRIQDELERLNKASEEINRLELELDDARASFRQALTDSTYKLDALAKKLGSCVDKARPYYDARHHSKEVHVETQKAAYMFERACSMHEAAKEMVQLAEQGYLQREDSGDPAWQEMLNHATMKVNDAEMERLESEKVHMITTQKFKDAEEQVHKLQRELKRSINKSKPYFEMKAKFNHMMEERKKNVMELENMVMTSKKTYSDALRSLEEISEAIHQKRIDMRNQAELGIRGAGVGSESPSPPPMRGNVHVAIDGKTTHFVSSCNTGSPTTVTLAQFSVSDSSSQDFQPPSVIYSTPEKARSESYRQAIENRQSLQGNLDDITEDYSVNLDDEYLALPGPSKDESDVFNQSHDRDSFAKGYNKSRDSSPGRGKKPAKLKGLILVPVDAGLDPLQANVKIKTKSHITRSRTEPVRPKSYPYSHNKDTRERVITPVASPTAKHEKFEEEEVLTPASEKSFRKLLRVPSVQDFDEGSISDTESVTSGAMLDDDQVEFLTLDFSKCKLDSIEERSPRDHEYRRLSLPATLKELGTLVRQLSSENTAISPRSPTSELPENADETLVADDADCHKPTEDDAISPKLTADSSETEQSLPDTDTIESKSSAESTHSVPAEVNIEDLDKVVEVLSSS